MRKNTKFLISTLAVGLIIFSIVLLSSTKAAAGQGDYSLHKKLVRYTVEILNRADGWKHYLHFLTGDSIIAKVNDNYTVGRKIKKGDEVILNWEDNFRSIFRGNWQETVKITSNFKYEYFDSPPQLSLWYFSKNSMGMPFPLKNLSKEEWERGEIRFSISGNDMFGGIIPDEVFANRLNYFRIGATKAEHLSILHIVSPPIRIVKPKSASESISKVFAGLFFESGVLNIFKSAANQK